MAGFKTEPSVSRKISEINPNLDTRVRILGKIIDVQNSFFVMDDGSGSTAVSYSDESPKPAEIKTGMLVRVIGFVIPSDPPEIQAEIIHDMDKLNIKFLDLMRQ
jgi:RecJ-like exonuclease